MLPASNRLRSRKDFSRTTKTGHRATSQLLVIYFLTHAQFQSEPQVGLIINKSVGGSVTRHRIARQLRHAASERVKDFPAHTQIVIRVLRKSDDYRADFTELVSKIVKRSEANQ